MQFTTLTLAALSLGSALAQEMVTTHVVRVGSLDGSNTFSPSDLKANVGDMVQFQFAPKNHTVTQSTFDKPCEPSALNSNITGVYSGYIPVAADAANTATWTIKVASQTPMWLYCSQAKHCQSGMVMVINAPAANASRTLESYKTLAASVTNNLPGDAIAGGSSGTSPSNGTTGGGSGSGSDTGSGSGAGTGSGASPTNADGSAATPSASGVANTNSGSVLRAGEAMGIGAVIALGMALFV